MSTKRKTRPVAGTTGRERQGNSLAGVFPCSDFTTSTGQRQDVSDLLCVGEQNGQTMKHLQKILGDDSRSIRVRIERERKNTPILSGGTGYFLPERDEEVRKFCASMRHRARQIWATAANVERAACLTRAVKHQLDGQLTIDGGGGDG